MIEVPEAAVLANQINQALKGKRIANSEANHTPHGNTVGQPCPVCGSIIKKKAYLGGAIYYCEGCQVI